MRPGLVLLLLLLSACGQRGPLYLPDEPEPETVMSTGDASGETDEQTDWQQTGTAPDEAAGEGTTGKGETESGTELSVSPTAEGQQSSPAEVKDNNKDAKDKEATSGAAGEN
jgi:predicted small lipoprotein YifL